MAMPAPDADVEHEAVEPAGGGVGDDRGAVVVGRDVADEHARGPAFALDQAAVSSAASAVAVGAHDRRAFARREHRDGAAVADRRLGVVGALRAGADDEDAPAGEPRSGRRCGHGPSSPATPGSRCTPSEFSVNATRW